MRIYTFKKHKDLIGEIVAWHPGRQPTVVTRLVTAAWMPDKPGRWGIGWMDRFEEVDVGGGMTAIAMDVTGGEPAPILRRTWGIVRWTEKEGAT